MKPYGEEPHSRMRGGLGRRAATAGGSYDTTATERARVKRQPKRRARQAGKDEIEQATERVDEQPEKEPHQ